jgi:tRNA modification GTPase
VKGSGPVADSTIVALATPLGRSAVAVVRLSGVEALAVAQRVCPRGPRWQPRRATLRLASDPVSGHRVDQVLAIWMPGPQSYTGEDVVELSCHGNPRVADALVRACLGGGATLARPGEFTRRAVESGRLTVLQAEAVGALIEASSLEGARIALSGLAGAVDREIRALREQLLDLAAELEARLDHPGDDLGHLDDNQVVAQLQELSDHARRLAAGWARNRPLIHGAKVALLGPVNAGKSSLFNRLLGVERALVSPVAGTTRDVVEARMDLGGVEVTLLDTAGRHDDAGPLEQAGILIADRMLADVDLVLLVAALVDGPGAEQAFADQIAALAHPCGDRPFLVVGTHADRLGAGRSSPHLMVSSQTGQGVDALREAIRSTLSIRPAVDELIGATSQRQHAGLLGVAQAADEAATALLGLDGPAVAAYALVDGLVTLGEVLGQDVREEVLDRLFERFCIGK